MTMIQVRNVPEDVHRLLKVRAAQRGTSLSEYLLSEILQHAARPTLDEALDVLLREPAVEITETAVDMVRAERDRR